MTFGAVMKINIPGEMTITDMRQCLLEQLFDISERFNVRYARGINLYFTPTDGQGNEVICKNSRGEEISQIESEGRYPSAAERYDI